jgi:DNA-directed RNA polymerase specialized sigma24 family protein
MEKPPGAIKALQHRALARLRKVMQGKEEHELDE